MRYLLIVLGLAFVVAVLVDNAEAINCYVEDPRTSGGKKDVSYCNATVYVIPITKCYIYNDEWGRWGPEHGIWRDCAPGHVCEDNAYDKAFRCCSSDFCNGGDS